ncbi:MAG: helix-turn-helix transcriptional regulator [Gammaproteobacteria bacterium]|nr:helix-turn-helix transcriptional regulator [Gammaproteobacteria bacterium]
MTFAAQDWDKNIRRDPFERRKRKVLIEVESDFSEFLVTARNAAGLTQEQLSERLSVSRSALAHWETGKAIPTLPAFSEWCRAVGVTPNDALGF